MGFSLSADGFCQNEPSIKLIAYMIKSILDSFWTKPVLLPEHYAGLENTTFFIFRVFSQLPGSRDVCNNNNKGQWLTDQHDHILDRVRLKPTGFTRLRQMQIRVFNARVFLACESWEGSLLYIYLIGRWLVCLASDDTARQAPREISAEILEQLQWYPL